MRKSRKIAEECDLDDYECDYDHDKKNESHMSAFEKAYNNTKYGDDPKGWKEDIYKSYKKAMMENNPLSGDDEAFEDIPEEKDPNIDLIMFYGKLLVEKLTRMPNIGKMEIDGDFKVKRIGVTDVYEVDIDITHNFDKMSADHVIDTMKEIKQLEDGKNNVSVSIDGTIYVTIKVDYTDIKDLEPAKEAVTKFKL